MKNRHKKMIGAVVAVVLGLFLVYAVLLILRSIPEGAVPVGDIVSACGGDAVNDGTHIFLAVVGGDKIDTGERYGEFLLVCDPSAEADSERLGYISPEKIRHRIDLTDIKPMKVQLGDINGDGLKEIALCVYKTAKFHPVLAKRPFFFQLIEGNLIPIWLGSRLSRPFDDYLLNDLDGDAIDEIIAIEHLENGSRVLAVYDWKGFGFELFCQSEEMVGELYFTPATDGQITETDGQMTEADGQVAEADGQVTEAVGITAILCPPKEPDQEPVAPVTLEFTLKAGKLSFIMG